MEKIKTIIKEPNWILRQKTQEIPKKEIAELAAGENRWLQKLIGNMKEALKNTTDGVGLAAPQIGESLRLFIVSEEAEEIDRLSRQKEDVSPEERKKIKERAWNYYVFINPVVKNKSRRRIDGPEGCLSVPGKFGDVKRLEKITVEAYDEHGKKFTRGASNFFARVVQHELDHLEGTLFIDKASNLN